MDKCIFIGFNTPSSKNGRRWVKKGSIGSVATEKYYKLSKQYWIDNTKAFLEMLKGKQKPYKIELRFVRGSRRRFDYLNPAQTIFDRMVYFKWIEDDNAEVIIPSFAPYSYDKENPGCYIRVL